MKIKPIRKDLHDYLLLHNLSKKWEKAVRLFEQDPNYPSLRTELLEPKSRGIYSFRIDRKYRALFFVSDSEVEVFQITNHYKKR